MSRAGAAWFSCFRGVRLVPVLVAFSLGCSETTPKEKYPDASLFVDAGADSADVAAVEVPRDTGPMDLSVGDRIVEPSDFASLGVLLREGRLSGWIHAAVPHRSIYVFTYRKPGDFFSFVDFPLVAATDTIAMKLATVKRHDAVVLKGDYIDNKIAPLRHIAVTDLQVTTVYKADETAAPRTPETEIPNDLLGATELIGKVHAVNSDGRVFVIEYGDAVIPCFVRVPALTAGLYRNDKIRIKFEFAMAPPKPTHLWLDTAAAQPIEVMERLLDKHGQPYEAEGTLVRFPLSPQISVEVFALQLTDADGVTRELTLLNTDPTIFTRIREKLSMAWKSRPGEGIDGRNKLINPKIKVRAKGTFNLVDRNQANAQILLASPDDITVTIVP